MNGNSRENRENPEDRDSLIPRHRAEEIISGLADGDRGEPGRLAYREALWSMAANIVGTAILDLRDGQVVGSCYVEGHRYDPDHDHELILCEYDAERQNRRSGAGYDYSGVLSDEEGGELRALLRDPQSTTRSDPTVIASTNVKDYLAAKGESLESREEQALTEFLKGPQWPAWDDIKRQLDRAYG